jgi:uncharacterized peroxidase-related enzyme
VVHHGSALAQETGRAELAEAVASGNWEDLDERSKALLTYAQKVTLRPSDVQESDLAPLRGAGLTDRDIVDANQVVAYFNYVNRIADGLGVELEDRWPRESRPRKRYGLTDGQMRR